MSISLSLQIINNSEFKQNILQMFLFFCLGNIKEKIHIILKDMNDTIKTRVKKESNDNFFFKIRCLRMYGKLCKKNDKTRKTFTNVNIARQNTGFIGSNTLM